jgi:hypothetical protein
MKDKLIIISAIALFGCASCETDPHKSPEEPVKSDVIIPAFNPDSAYLFVKHQVDFGPRVPNSAEHEACANYLVQKLESFGANVIVQEAVVKGYDGTRLNMKNIIGQFFPENKRRIMLYAHWDTRPWADRDPDPANWHTPIDGANDGASGVAVLLEIARHFQEFPPDHGIDIIFFDAEDYGTPEFASSSGGETTWCLGSQYWAANPHEQGYRAKFGVLLDMVGGKTASFPKEGTSMYYADYIVEKIWKAAKKTGHSKFFTNDVSGATTDDHRFVNEIAGIPSACIVEYHTNVQIMGLQGYGDYHHTHKDNMDVISAETLGAVGEVLQHVIYLE